MNYVPSLEHLKRQLFAQIEDLQSYTANIVSYLIWPIFAASFAFLTYQ